MATNIPHILATEHLPVFVAGPGETDVFFIIVVVIMIVAVMLIGVFYFYLHALPEKMAHKVNSRQLQFVAILSLIALFTHNNYFWIAALLLAAIKIPDFVTPINSIARSIEKKIRTGGLIFAGISRLFIANDPSGFPDPALRPGQTLG